MKPSVFQSQLRNVGRVPDPRDFGTAWTSQTTKPSVLGAAPRAEETKASSGEQTEQTEGSPGPNIKADEAPAVAPNPPLSVETEEAPAAGSPLLGPLPPLIELESGSNDTYKSSFGSLCNEAHNLLHDTKKRLLDEVETKVQALHHLLSATFEDLEVQKRQVEQTVEENNIIRKRLRLAGLLD